VKFKVAAKKWLLWQANTKILIMAIQINLVQNLSEMWRRQHKFTRIFVIKNFSVSLSLQPFLAATLDMAVLGPKTFFYS